MNLYKQINFYTFILIIFFNSLVFAQANDVKIIMKINNQIITNIDIKNEYNYLIALNKNLETINKDKVLLLAKESLIKEILRHCRVKWMRK